MIRRFLLSLSLCLPLLAGCWCVQRDDSEVAPPVPPSSAVASRDAYGVGVGKAFASAAVQFRNGTSEAEINKQMAESLHDLPEKSFMPLMKRLGSANSPNEKAALLESWADELGVSP